MNTRNCLGSCGRMAALLLLLPLAARLSATVEAAKDPASEPPTHVLFTGADIRVFHKGKPYPVEDVDGSSLVIRYKDSAKGFGIPASDRNPKFAVLRVLTLADRSATVTNFKHERAYTEANNPFVKASNAMHSAMAAADNARIMEDKVRATPEKILVLRAGEITPTEIDNPHLPELKLASERAQNAAGALSGSAYDYAGRMAADQALENFDALEVQFELASDKSIQAAYMVVLAQYHTEARPNDSESWIVARSLGEIGPKPQKVWLREGGLPPGYILESVRVHLYENGTEIATNLSENRADLTRDEAHEYLVIDHMSTHKTDTIPAQLALTRFPEDWATRPRDESFRKTYHVKVDERGRPVGVFEDEACKTPTANSYSNALLRDQLFLPALDKGKPVESVVRIKLSKLPMRPTPLGSSIE